MCRDMHILCTLLAVHNVAASQDVHRQTLASDSIKGTKDKLVQLDAKPRLL